MNEIIGLVTPNTRAIIWLPGEVIISESETYRQVDYLLDGLLTATLNTTAENSSLLLLGNSFNSPLHVFIVRKTVDKEVQGFITLISKELTGENRILVIDEASKLREVLKNIPKDIQSKLHQLKT